MSNLTEDTLSPSEPDGHINRLNHDCLAYIFQFLPYTDRVRVDRVCSRWRDISLNCWNQYARSHTSLEIGTDTGTFPRRLELLNLQMFEQILKKRGPYLTKISFAAICRSRFEVEGTIKMVIKYCPMIRNIRAESVLLWPSDLAALATCSQIESLGLGCGYKLNAINMMDLALKPVFKANKNLRHLTLSKNNSPIGMCLRDLEPNVLETLRIVECPFFHFDEACIQRFEHSLRELTVYYDQYDSDTILLPHVPKLKNLRKLKLVGDVWIMKEQMVGVLHPIVRSCRKLEHVDLGAMTFVASENDMEPVFSLPELRKIVISSKTSITPKMFVDKKLDKLETLEMACCLLSEADYEYLIYRLPKLKALTICDCIVRIDSEWLLSTAQEKSISILLRPCKNDEMTINQLIMQFHTFEE